MASVQGGPSPLRKVGSVAKPALGNKHYCKNCGTRFFDLNTSPIFCPKCGTVSQAVPLSRAAQSAAAADKDKGEVVPVAELVSLEEADAGEDKVVVVADDDVEDPPTILSSRKRKRITTMSAISSMARSGRKKNAEVRFAKHGGRSGCVRPRSLSAVRGRQRRLLCDCFGTICRPAGRTNALAADNCSKKIRPRGYTGRYSNLSAF